jgi:hypothetical protein
MQWLIRYAHLRYLEYERFAVCCKAHRVINAVSGGTAYQPGAWRPTPDQIDYVIGQLTGGVGREIGKLAQTISAPFTGDELTAHNIPLLGRLYGGTQGVSAESELFFA